MIFPVTLSDGQTYTVVGYLHHQGGYTQKPLQVVLHGATYTHQYWMFSGFEPGGLSYTDYMLRQGYSVLALDLLGSGESSRPNGDFLDLATLSDSVRQVVGQLRGGQNSLGVSWSTIVAVGHSLGSAVAIHAQATSSPFNTLVTTALGHEPHLPPAPADLHLRALSSPYFHLYPHERTSLFFHAPSSRQAVIDYDNATFAEPISRGVYDTVMVRGFDPRVSRVDQVRGPVLVQLGEQDVIYPGANASQEPGHWPQATVTVQVIVGTGHSFNMHEGRHASWGMMVNWLRATLGEGPFGGSRQPSEPRLPAGLPAQ
jgi:alpha-beta hydrolase superfamily lysophospholipase